MCPATGKVLLGAEVECTSRGGTEFFLALINEMLVLVTPGPGQGPLLLPHPASPLCLVQTHESHGNACTQPLARTGERRSQLALEGGCSNHLHFTDKETEAQKSETACPGSPD